MSDDTPSSPAPYVPAETLPGVSPSRWHSREDSGLTLDRHGRWWHDGVAIQHAGIIEAFNRGVQVEDDGRYRLVFGNDWCFITVEGPAYGVVAVDEGPGDALWLRLTDRTAEVLDAPTLALDDEGVLTAAVKGGRARARFSRDAQFQLAQWLDESGHLRVGSLRLHVPWLFAAP